MFAVCARFPHHLARQVPWTPVQPGVYECRRGTDSIRVIVLGQLERSAHNALLHLFSASQEQVRYGAEHYRQRSDETSSLLYRLLDQYRKEGVSVPYTMEDFVRDFVKEHLKEVSPEERAASLSTEELLASLSTEELLASLSTEELLASLSTEERLMGLSLDERLLGLSPEEIAALVKRAQARDTSTPSE